MTFLWLFWWLCNDTPSIFKNDSWATGLVICVILDLFMKFKVIS